MVLKDILHIYHKELDEIYGKNEVNSFFNLVLEHYLKLSRIHLVLEPDYVVTKTEEQPLFKALSRLKLEEPIQYIIGETEFYGLPFKVNEHTLIPRPETEELVEWVKTDFSFSRRDAAERPSALNILDIGTGSGCIAISLAKHLPYANVFAIDVSKDALKVAKQNAKLNDVNIAFSELNILYKSTWDFEFSNVKFDVIMSNPPYVRHLEKAHMKANVLNNEPHLALFVNDDNPLQFYRAICEFAQTKLKDNGILYFEINEYLGQAMVALLKEFGFKTIQLKQDIFGKDRMIKGEK